MGFVVSEAQRKALEESEKTATAVASNLASILRDNHARVLDFFRKVDTNGDGCISKGEFAFTLHSLGLNASPKEIEHVFCALDPSGDGIVEFSELQDALLHGRFQAKPKPPKLTAKQREVLRQENKQCTYELTEMIYAFERQRGLDDPTQRPPPAAADLLHADKMARLQEAARKARESGAPVDRRGELMSRMDACWVKSKLLRPQTAPARVSQAAAAARRKQAQYEHWLLEHREEIQSHQLAVEHEYAEDKRIRRERVQNRRAAQLALMRSKQAASRLGALERHEPFPTRKELLDHKSGFFERQRQRAWAQPIVFLPPPVAARDPSLVRERRAADYEDNVRQVRELSERGL